ncbi:hypothetical protein KKI24_07120 [bacterium]|nr:hypothetical protein [bacterium]
MTPEQKAYMDHLQVSHDMQTEIFKAISSAIKEVSEDMAAEAVMLALVGDKIPHVKLTIPSKEEISVYSRPECIYHYCPSPDICKEKCHHPAPEF